MYAKSSFSSTPYRFHVPVMMEMWKRNHFSSLDHELLWNAFIFQFSPPAQCAHISLREKAIAVAERVTTAKERESLKVSCPVCFDVMQASNGADLRMTLALHLSLWHPDDVKLQWDMMHKKNNMLSIHFPSVIIGAGVAAGFVALVAISARNRTLEPRVRVRR